MGDFTPTLKQLFLFLLLNTIKNGKETTSQCLDETFWFDMSRSSASDNRNVNIRKLRLIIEKVGDINTANKNGYWYLNLGKDVTCDYQEVTRLLDQIKNTITGKKITNKTISLASAGALLPNVSAEWIDEYKPTYYVLLTEILLSVVNRPDIKEDSRLLLKISDVILLVDSIDEGTIRTKRRVLYQVGQEGPPKQSFDKFCIEYERLLNVKSDSSYDDIINSLQINPLLTIFRCFPLVGGEIVPYRWWSLSSSVPGIDLVGTRSRSLRSKAPIIPSNNNCSLLS